MYINSDKILNLRYLDLIGNIEILSKNFSDKQKELKINLA